MGLIFRTAAVILALTVPCSSARLSVPAQQAFDTYVVMVEKRLGRQHGNSGTYLAALDLGADERTNVERQLRLGAIRMEPVDGGTREVSGGLLHHWRGVAFVPGARASDMLALLRDYSHLSTYYAPEVESSRLLSDRAGTATVAMRFKKQMVIPIVLDTEYDVRTGLTSAGEGYSFSRSIHIWEIEGTGTSRERRMTEGDDDGFLWGLNTYWSFLEVPDGLLIECEAISLTRDVPAGLGWLVTPIIQDMPRESLKFTLTATQSALSSNARKEARR
jgi:hypothetical protein